jgi:hypothetical protein
MLRATLYSSSVLEIIVILALQMMTHCTPQAQIGMDPYVRHPFRITFDK